MRRSTRRKLVPLALALALAMVGAAFAVPQITVYVQQLGAGNNPVVSPTNDAWVNFTLDTTNPDYITAVSANFSSTLPAGTYVAIKLYLTNQSAPVVASTTLSSALTAGQFTSDLPLPYEVDISDLNNVSVVVKSPTYSP
ncbi:hypothetical protein [Thermococcus sp.]|uniref:hypothetical protein n=1 Tax=Thermococcus sp. TaxID=35749 RepID=UPI00260E53AC|nr:hypothetical protein [Thermococcus sp.]